MTENKQSTFTKILSLKTGFVKKKELPFYTFD